MKAPTRVDLREGREATAEHHVAAEDLELRRELIRKGALRSREFTWERTARETLRVYEELLK